MRIPFTTGAVVALSFTLMACGGGTSADPGADPAAAPATDAAEASPETGETGDTGETVSITDAQGRAVDVPVDPQTVVVIDWSVIRTLNDLGIEVDAVPASTGALPEDLARYADGDVPQVGDVFEPDYEAIEAMQPDLVIVGSRSGTPEVVAEFERFAPAVLDMSVRADAPQDVLPMTRERVEQLGQVFGVEELATSTMDDLDAQIEELAAEISAAGESAMFVQVSDGSVSAYGPGSRFGMVYETFGYADTGAPVDEEGSHGQEISQEFFVQYDPEVMFVLDRAKAVGEEQTPALDVLQDGLAGDTTAAQDDRIVEVDGFSWYLAASAPSSLQRMVDDVAASR